MTKQSHAPSALTPADSLTTLLRIQYQSALVLRNLFLSVEDIYRKTSYLVTKIRDNLSLDKQAIKLGRQTDMDRCKTTANIMPNRKNAQLQKSPEEVELQNFLFFSIFKVAV